MLPNLLPGNYLFRATRAGQKRELHATIDLKQDDQLIELTLEESP